MSVLEFALDAAARGFRVIPLLPNGKKPFMKEWPFAATTDKDQITKWFKDRDYNYGNSTDGYAVVDIDPRNAGIEAWNDLVRATGLGPVDGNGLHPQYRTLTAQSAGGGFHLYYKLPPGKRFKSDDGVFGKGVDLKTGAGSQVVGPGSTINGKSYQWRYDVEPIELPPQLVEVAERAGKSSEKKLAEVKQLGAVLDTERAVAEATAYIEGLPEVETGRRNKRAYETAASVFDWPISDGMGLELMTAWNETKCSPPLDADELGTAVASGAVNRENHRGWIGSNSGLEPTEIGERQPEHFEDEERPRLYYLTLDQCEAKISEPRPKHLIEGMIPAGAMVVTYGESGQGKSSHTMDRDMHVVGGKPWCGHKATQGGVVWVAAEMSEDLYDRIEAVKQHLGLDNDTPFFAVPCPVDLLRPGGDTKPLIALVKEIEDKHKVKIVKVTIDTLSRALAGGNENAPDDMGALVKHLDAIRYECQCTVEAIHHCGKDTAKGARGHSLLRAATDTEIEVGQGRIKVTKQRSMAGGDAFSFRLKERHVGLRHDGSIAKSCYVETVKGDKRD
jgi:hypothetical protein